jgi:predicted porin
MKAIYQFELPFSADSNAGLSNTRSSWVGVSGAFGAVKLGKHDSPVKSLGRSIDPFNERIGDSRTVYLNGATVASEGSFANNSVVYDAPKLGPVSISALYSSSEASGSGLHGIGVTWSSGPFMVGIAQGGTHSNDSGGTSANEEIIRIAGRMTFGMVTINLLYDMQDATGNTKDADRDVMGGGVSLKIPGNNSVHFQYYTADELDNSANTGGSNMALAFEHAMSKNTAVYVAYASSDNDSSTSSFNYAATNAGHGNVLGVTASGRGNDAYSAGIEVKF